MPFLEAFKTFCVAYILIFPIYILTAAVNYFVRFCIWFYFKFTNYEFAPSMDNLLQNATLNGTIIVVLTTEQQSHSVDMIKEKGFVQTSIIDKLDKNGNQINKKLTYVWRQKFGYGCWKVHKDFDINNHVREIKSKDGTVIKESQFLQEILNPLTAAMPLTHPQWEWIVVQNVELSGTQKTVRILRVHHSIMDGVSIGLLLVNSILNFPQPDLSSPFVVDPFQKLPMNLKFQKFLQVTSAPLLLPWLLAETCLNKDVAEQDPFNTKAVYSGTTHLAQSPLLEARILRDIKTTVGPHMNVPTIVATAFKSAVTQWLPDSQRGRKGTFIKLESPAALLPVSSWSPNNSFLYSTTYFDTQDAPGEILPFSLDSRVWLVRWYCSWAGQFPLWIMKLLASTNDFTATVAMTNVPFTRVQGYLDNCLVEGLTTFAGLMKPLTLFVIVTRYGSVFRFCAQAEDSVMTGEELQHFVDNMAKGVQDLANK